MSKITFTLIVGDGYAMPSPPPGALLTHRECERSLLVFEIWQAAREAAARVNVAFLEAEARAEPSSDRDVGASGALAKP